MEELLDCISIHPLLSVWRYVEPGHGWLLLRWEDHGGVGLLAGGSDVLTVGHMFKLEVAHWNEAKDIRLGLLEGTSPGAVHDLMEATDQLILLGSKMSLFEWEEVSLDTEDFEVFGRLELAQVLLVDHNGGVELTWHPNLTLRACLTKLISRCVELVFNSLDDSVGINAHLVGLMGSLGADLRDV